MREGGNKKGRKEDGKEITAFLLSKEVLPNAKKKDVGGGVVIERDREREQAKAKSPVIIQIGKDLVNYMSLAVIK